MVRNQTINRYNFSYLIADWVGKKKLLRYCAWYQIIWSHQVIDNMNNNCQQWRDSRTTARMRSTRMYDNHIIYTSLSYHTTYISMGQEILRGSWLIHVNMITSLIMGVFGILSLRSISPNVTKHCGFVFHLTRIKDIHDIFMFGMTSDITRHFPVWDDVNNQRYTRHFH